MSYKVAAAIYDATQARRSGKERNDSAKLPSTPGSSGAFTHAPPAQVQQKVQPIGDPGTVKAATLQPVALPPTPEQTAARSQLIGHALPIALPAVAGLVGMGVSAWKDHQRHKADEERYNAWMASQGRPQMVRAASLDPAHVRFSKAHAAGSYAFPGAAIGGAVGLARYLISDDPDKSLLGSVGGGAAIGAGLGGATGAGLAAVANHKLRQAPSGNRHIALESLVDRAPHAFVAHDFGDKVAALGAKIKGVAEEGADRLNRHLENEMRPQFIPIAAPPPSIENPL